MARIRIGFNKNRPPILKWSEVEVGTTFEGHWSGLRAGTYGPLLDLSQNDGTVLCMPVSKVLQKKLAQVRAGGHPIHITYRGMIDPPRGGNPYHDFEVEADERDVLPAETQQADGATAIPADEAMTGDDIPF